MAAAAGAQPASSRAAYRRPAPRSVRSTTWTGGANAKALATVVLGLTTSRCCSAVECKYPWQAVGQHCFLLSSGQHTFESCQRDVCGPQGGTLACLRPDESGWLTWKIGLGRSRDVLAVWTGLFEGAEGWSWVSGCNNTWQHWLQGEPDDYCGGEDCAAMTGASGGWMDVSCRLRLPCLCEYGGAPTAKFNSSIARLRDDTCYADCGDLTKWCTAWPFARLYDVNDDICHWEEKDGEKRGRGASDCVARVEARADCGNFFSYSVGRCRCSPATGEHSNCTFREVDPSTDVFVLTGTEGGAELEYAGQRCVYGIAVDDAYFGSLMPASTFADGFVIWIRAAAIWMAFGFPCFFVIFVVTLRSISCCAREMTEIPMPSFGDSDVGDVQGGTDASYGPLLDTTDDADAGEAVNRWVFRGAVGSIVYGLALLALGATLAMHMAGKSSGFGMEVLEALVMTIAMAADARAATMVHRKLSPIARQVAGRWVLVLAVAKHGLALTALGGVIVFSTLADRDYENICFGEYMFRWSMLMALPLQCLAGLCINRVQVNAEPYVGSLSRMDGWIPLLVIGSFCSGAGVWCAGYLDSVHELVVAVAAFFILAAVGQLSAGVALLKVNFKVKQIARGAAANSGERGSAEMAPTSFGRAGGDEDSVVDGAKGDGDRA